MQLSSLLAMPDGGLWVAGTRPGSDVGVVGPMDTNTGQIQIAFELPDTVAAMVATRDGSAIYASVPARGAIYHLSMQDRRKRIFADLPKVAGSPAALALDGNERVWVAMTEGWSVIRLNEDGDFDRTIAVPVPAPTGICFGGENYDRIFVTSARLGLNREALMHAPLSGHVLELEDDQLSTPSSVTTLAPIL